MPAVLGPITLRAALARRGQHVHGVVHRHVLGEAHDLADAGVDGVERRLLHAERRDEHHGGVDVGVARGVAAPRPTPAGPGAVSPARLGLTPPTILRAVVAHALGPERALLAGDALHEHRLAAAQDHDASAAPLPTCGEGLGWGRRRSGRPSPDPPPQAGRGGPRACIIARPPPRPSPRRPSGRRA